MKGMAVVLVAVMLAGPTQPAIADPYTQEFINKLLESKCNNCLGYAKKVGYTDQEVNPFVDALATGYDTLLKDKDCVVKVQPNESEQEDKLVYRLKEVTAGTPLGANEYLTHTGPCGVCSDLQSLGAFLDNPGLAVSSAQCSYLGLLFMLGLPNPPAFTELVEAVSDMQMALDAGTTFEELFPNTFSGAVKITMACIQFSSQLEGLCLAVWAFNAMAGLQCAGPCLQSGFLNPNEPVAPPGAINYCHPSVCSTTINGGPACYEEAYIDGDFRLTDCHQCGECRTSPRYFEVAGRGRRNSGLPSAFDRPPDQIAEIEHTYGLLE